MSTEGRFLWQLRECPEDDTTRLVFADWLEERGDVRGEYLRKEVELAGLAEGTEESRRREEELRTLRVGIDPDWLELAGKRFDVWVVSPPVLPPIPPLPRQDLERLGILPRLAIENCLRAAAEEARDRLLAGLRFDPTDAKESCPVCIKPARAPRPRVCRFPAPTEPPGHALRLVGRPGKRRVAVFDAVLHAVRQVTGGSDQQARQLVEGELPRTLRTYATPEEARRAASFFERLVPVEVRYVDPSPHAAVLDRPLVGQFSVVLHRYPREVKPQLIEVLRMMTGCSRRQARTLAEAPLPLVVQRGLDWTRAEALRRALPARACVEVREDAAPGEGVPPASGCHTLFGLT
jgi:uncharacterized protein (TIGR02996 family)